jgi:hypothetical protein
MGLKKNRRVTVFLDDERLPAVESIARRDKMTNYAVVQCAFEIGMSVINRSGNNLEAARQAAVMSDIELIVPPETSEGITRIEKLLWRVLMHQLQNLWVSSLHADSVRPGTREEAIVKAADLFAETRAKINGTDDQG